VRVRSTLTPDKREISGEKADAFKESPSVVRWNIKVRIISTTNTITRTSALYGENGRTSEPIVIPSVETGACSGLTSTPQMYPTTLLIIPSKPRVATTGAIALIGPDGTRLNNVRIKKKSINAPSMAPERTAHSSANQKLPVRNATSYATYVEKTA
jgi:hypothetical protein